MDQAFLTTLAAIGGFIGKSVWDLYWRRREGFEALVRQKRLEFVDRQLSLFYWPVYLHLQKNNVVWNHLVDGADRDSDQSPSIGATPEYFRRLSLKTPLWRNTTGRRRESEQRYGWFGSRR